jgi:hypothetical protein
MASASRTPIPCAPADRPSVAFCINIGSNHPVSPDLRGNFWEWQIPAAGLNATVTYVGDGPCSLLRNQSCLVVPRGGLAQYRDDRQCLRTENGWEHFLRHRPDTRWYFKGVHDTFVNLTLLGELLCDLETRGDPMTQALFAFNLHDWDGYLYPQGGSGWVFSHHAVSLIWANFTRYHQICDGAYADDVAIAPFLKTIGIDVEDFLTSKFAIYWPEQPYGTSTISDCPDAYFRGYSKKPLRPVPVRSCVAAHMRWIPMNQALGRMQGIPNNIRIT